MNILLWIILANIGILCFTSSILAELLLQDIRLTINVNAVPLESVLYDLSQQGAFRVTVLEKQTSKQASISDRVL